MKHRLLLIITFSAALFSGCSNTIDDPQNHLISGHREHRHVGFSWTDPEPILVIHECPICHPNDEKLK